MLCCVLPATVLKGAGQHAAPGHAASKPVHYTVWQRGAAAVVVLAAAYPCTVDGTASMP